MTDLEKFEMWFYQRYDDNGGFKGYMWDCWQAAKQSQVEEIEKLQEENARLREIEFNADKITASYKDQIDESKARLEAIKNHCFDFESKRVCNVFEAAKKTLLENLDLCDGDICTLYDLKIAVLAIEPSFFEEDGE